MHPSLHVSVAVDLARVRVNVEHVAGTCGVPVIAVVKADAYGLGADRVAPAIADLVEGFYVFSLAEAASAGLWERTGKPVISLSPADSDDAGDYLAAHVRPAVWCADRAALLRRARPVLSVETGMQRFACPPEQINAALMAGEIDEAFTHAVTAAQVRRLVELVGDRKLKLHAAGTALLDLPEARLDAVRPGLAMYQGAVTVLTPLVEVRMGKGPAGYTGFDVVRHGVILAGYSNGLRPGPCLINGRRQRVLEVGMQSAFVEVSFQDRVGDDVVLLGGSITESEVAAAWETTPQQVLVTLTAMGSRRYLD